MEKVHDKFIDHLVEKTLIDNYNRRFIDISFPYSSIIHVVIVNKSNVKFSPLPLFYKMKMFEWVGIYYFDSQKLIETLVIEYFNRLENKIFDYIYNHENSSQRITNEKGIRQIY
jgi:hypothetical protein